MDVTQFIVLAVFASTICALIFTNQRPSTVFSGAVLAFLVTQQLSHHFANLTNKGLITLVLLLLVSSAIDKTAPQNARRKLVSANFTQSTGACFH